MLADHHLHAVHEREHSSSIIGFIQSPRAKLGACCKLYCHFFSLPHCHSEKVDSSVNPQLINCGHRLLGSPRTRQEAPVTKIGTLEAPGNMY